MSAYTTPCFPPTDVAPSGKRRPISSSNSSSTSISRTHSPPKLSYSDRLSRSHSALASVSELISRPPSPTSAAVDTNRVTQLRQKFRLAVDATYRDTSNGKWGHVAEMAKLGSTRGRWQGMCSGCSAQHSLCKPHEQKDQDPYPPTPDPIFDFREVRERVESWKANVLSAPPSQADSQDAELNQPIHLGDVRQPSQLDFPTVKQRRCDIAKTTKRKNSPSRKDRPTSRYFHAVATPKSPDAANYDTEAVTSSLSKSQGSNVDPMRHFQAEPLEMIAQNPSSTPVRAACRENIQQVPEQFLPPSFLSHLRTSTPPPLSTANDTHFRLTKPPEIPRSEVPASLPSPPPFPLSQATKDTSSESQLNDAPSPSTRKRSLQDGPSPIRSPNRPSKQRLQSSTSERPSAPPKSSSSAPPAGLHRRDLDFSPIPDRSEHIPVIDLRQLVSSQRSRVQSRHPSYGINPRTPETKDKGEGLEVTVDISPSQQNFLSPSLPSRPSVLAASPLRISPLSQINLTRDAGASVPVATSIQSSPAKGLMSLK